MSKRRGYTVFIHVAAVGTMLVILAPFAYLLCASVGGQSDLLARPLRWWPEHWTLSRYREIVGSGQNVATGFRSSMVNRFVVALCTPLVSLLIGTLGGYAL